MRLLKQAFYHLLPHHWLSRFGSLISRSEAKWLCQPIIRWFIGHYGVDMSLAVEPKPEAYTSFNHFFTRHLKPEVRPLCQGEKSIASPADGVISQMGAIKEELLVQAKGLTYSLSDLLGGDSAGAESLQGGEFMTVYLSPKDYHRVHMPMAGKLEKMLYIPGRLFSVNTFSTTSIPNLFTRNERAVIWFRTEVGPMVVVMVGAMLVASIHTAWAGMVAPQKASEIITTSYTDRDIHLNKGEELGFFELGSTVITLFPRDVLSWDSALQANSPVVMGQEIAVLAK